MVVNYSDQIVGEGLHSIFLAGPTPRDNETQSWRPDAILELEQFGYDGLVYIPEYSTGEVLKSYLSQVEWERDALHKAEYILFWIPRELQKMPAFTTNVEFGYYLAKNPQKVYYGRPDDAPKTKYLDWLYFRETGRLPQSSIHLLIRQVIAGTC